LDDGLDNTRTQLIPSMVSFLSTESRELKFFAAPAIVGVGLFFAALFEARGLILLAPSQYVLFWP
jgi:hypothetical protein